MRLMRLLPATLLLTSASLAVHAQSSTDRPTFGVYGGLNLATIAGNDVDNAAYQAGLVFGLSARWHLSGGRWAFQPAIEYSQKGVSTTSTTPPVVTANAHVNYAEIPLLLRVQADKMQGATPYLLFGPAVGFKTSCDLKAKSGAVTVSARCSDFAKIESLDFGAMFGVGTDFAVGGLTWTLAARYDLGLKKIASDSDGKNRAFSFLLGLNW